MIPESDHPEPSFFEIRCPLSILKRILQMLSAIYLDNQFFFEANKIKIKDIAIKRMLSTELAAV